jgi:DNA-binding NarL/FixJ family response regulator
MESAMDRNAVLSDMGIAAEDRQLLSLLAKGHPPQVVARELSTSERTLRRRIRALCDRIGVATPIEAVAWAIRSGLI